MTKPISSNQPDKESRKFMRYTLRQLKHKDALKLKVVAEFEQWLDSTTLTDLRSIALAKMYQGQAEHGPLKSIPEINRWEVLR